MAVDVLPDAEALATQFLKTQPDVMSVLGADPALKVGTRLPDGATFPRLRVSLVGGIPVIQRPLYLGAPRIQVEAFADNEVTAGRLARTAEGALLQINGLVVDNGVGDRGWISGVEEALGIFRNPDPETGRPRYQFDVTIYVHP